MRTLVFGYCLGLAGQDSVWYQTLVSGLTQAQVKELEEIFKLAEQKKAVASK